MELNERKLLNVLGAKHTEALLEFINEHGKTRHKDMMDSFNPTNNINITESTHFLANPYDGEDRNKKEMI